MLERVRASPDDAGPSAADNAGHAPPARVLVVDDHEGFRAVARALLEGDGLLVVAEAADGAEALAAAERLRPDLVLLDVHLPDLDGFDVSVRLASLPRPPVVVLTSSRPIADLRRRVAESPAAGFVPKHLSLGRRAVCPGRMRWTRMIVALDAVAGSSILAVGILGWRRFRMSALFAMAAAVAWFAVPALPVLVLLHRPLLFHSILALPRGRVHGAFRALSSWLPGSGWCCLRPRSRGYPATAALCVAVAIGLQTSRALRCAGPDSGRDARCSWPRAWCCPCSSALVWPQYVEAGLPIATYLCAVTSVPRR